MTDTPTQRVLLVSDRKPTSRTVLERLAARGAAAAVVKDRPAAEAKLRDEACRLVLADWETLGEHAANLLDSARESWPERPCVLIDGPDEAEPTARAFRAGWDDYVPAPVTPDAVSRVIDRFLPTGEAPSGDPDACEGIAGKSPRLLEVVDLARRTAPSSMPVLVLGESGTGKELLSQLIHRHSRRSNRPYVHVNCAALNESLLESELFGHERGAFTGAVSQRKGRFERAHGGTLLLDEVSETGPRLQAELLRVLEQQDIERLGASEPIRVDVRIIATSNRRLDEEVRRGRFRKDLYYRISGVRLRLPPLRERREDIPLLVRHFVGRYAPEVGRRIAKVDPRMLERFGAHDWPGNVRQLRNVVRSALVLGRGEELSLQGLPSLLPDGEAPADVHATLQLQELERRAIFEALRRTKSHQAKAARLLGITDRTLREKLRRYRQSNHPEGPGEPECQAVRA